MSDGYVYLIVEGDQYGEEKYKIGITKNSPQERLRKLKTGNSNELDVLKVYRSRNYKKIERILHRKYATQRTLSENEFFYLTDEQVLGFIDSCKEAENIINALRDNPFYR
jgi:Meiotically up-regulated gene 113